MGEGERDRDREIWGMASNKRTKITAYNPGMEKGKTLPEHRHCEIIIPEGRVALLRTRSGVRQSTYHVASEHDCEYRPTHMWSSSLYMTNVRIKQCIVLENIYKTI